MQLNLHCSELTLNVATQGSVTKRSDGIGMSDHINEGLTYKLTDRPGAGDIDEVTQTCSLVLHASTIPLITCLFS